MQWSELTHHHQTFAQSAGRGEFAGEQLGAGLGADLDGHLQDDLARGGARVRAVHVLGTDDLDALLAEGRQALFGQLTWTTALLTLAYSLAGLGIAVVNDFKSVEGDRALGLQSLPVVFGIERASWISAGMIDVFQLAMVAVLIAIGQHFAAVLLVLLIIPQITFQDIWLLRDPVAFDVKYQASAQPFLVLGMLVTALAIGHSGLVVM